jgi:5-methylcytosine-specific restriction protein B
MPKLARDLDEARVTYDRQSHLEQVNKAEEKRQQVLKFFPLQEWPTMPLERYALGQADSKNTFCWWMEWDDRAREHEVRTFF